MRQLLFDFEWFRDPTQTAFELVGAEPGRSLKLGAPAEGETLVQTRPEMTVLLPTRQLVVLRRVTMLQSYRPLDLYRNLFNQFSRVQTPEGICNFIKMFGPLTNDGRNPDVGDDIVALMAHSRQMRKLLEAYAADDKIAVAQTLGPKGLPLDNNSIGDVEARIVFEPADGAFQLQLTPKNLISALWLQLGQFLSGKERLKICFHCSELFEVGAGTTRRADSKFCSDEHRIIHNSRRRTSGAD